jgi:hypothetical protein
MWWGLHTPTPRGSRAQQCSADAAATAAVAMEWAGCSRWAKSLCCCGSPAARRRPGRCTQTRAPRSASAASHCQRTRRTRARPPRPLRGGPWRTPPGSKHIWEISKGAADRYACTCGTHVPLGKGGPGRGLGSGAMLQADKQEFDDTMRCCHIAQRGMCYVQFRYAYWNGSGCGGSCRTGYAADVRVVLVSMLLMTLEA